MSLNRKITNGVVVLLIVVFCDVFSLVLAEEIDLVSKTDTEYIANLPLQWSPVPFADYAKVIKLLQSQSQGNISRIETLKGIYSVEFSQHLTSSQIRDITEAAGTSKGATQTVNFDLEFVADARSNFIYRKKTMTGNDFKEMGQSEKIKTENLAGTEYVAIERNDVSIERSLMKQNTFQELPDYPDMTERNVARKYTSAKVANMHLAEYINILKLIDLKNWEPLDVAMRTLQSHNASVVKKMSSYYFIYESNTPIKWYAIQVVFDDTTFNRKMVRKSFWNESNGFLPLGMSAYVIKNDGSEELSNLTVATWKKFGGVFVPETYLQMNYLPDGMLSFSRSLKAQKLEINTPLDPNQFELAALGLKDGDYLLDEIRKQVFTIQNGKPVYQAKFYEKYQTSQEPGRNRILLLIMTSGLILIAFGIYLKIRRKKSENNKK
ncbi:MAG: hypothetical protein LBP59_12780 [Planctomycetaceae bacterium]|jgi:hypothetical protein|nr:hypothetical protein [Planctomycetaceae bacterium]